MKKFGIIYCGYNTEDYVLESIEPFLKRDNHVVSAVSVPFKEYKGIDTLKDHTTDLLRELVEQRRLKYLVDTPEYISEPEARNYALFYLTKYDLDYIWLVDSDEFYTERDIEEIEKYVESSDKNLFKISLRNFVFDKDHYLEEPFCPPRIFKTKINDYRLAQFIWDNDIAYGKDGEFVLHSEVEALTNIPEGVALIKHYSWLNDRIGKRKVEYQHRHFGACSYKWNYQTHSLEFDEEYYKKIGEPIPKVNSIYDD
jgi:hypothetical protein